MSTLCLGLLASGADWEAEVLRQIEAAPRMMVLKRSVDLDDMMASVTTGQLQVAVLAAEVPGLDVAAVQHLVRHGVTPVAVLTAARSEVAREHLAHIGVRTILDAASIGELPALVRALGETPATAPAGLVPVPVPTPARLDRQSSALAVPGAGLIGVDQEKGTQPGRVLAVWGPVGAPGRTTVATGIAGILADRGRPVIVVDADPSASVAQQLGVLDQVSGLLAAARLQASGTLTGRVQGVCRALTPRLGVLTGVPRPERRWEVLPGAVVEVVDELTTFADVVVDLGSALDHDASPGAPGVWALDVLERADDVLVVGAADPVGLTRLAHALGDLREAAGDLRARVVVNRTRPSLGWSEKEMADVVSRAVPVHALHFLPFDQAAIDRALVEGVPPTSRESRFARALASVVDAARPETVISPPAKAGRIPRPRKVSGRAGRAPGSLLRRRRAGTARPQ